jgi:hypothetical protein
VTTKKRGGASEEGARFVVETTRRRRRRRKSVAPLGPPAHGPAALTLGSSFLIPGLMGAEPARQTTRRARTGRAGANIVFFCFLSLLFYCGVGRRETHRRRHCSVFSPHRQAGKQKNDRRTHSSPRPCTTNPHLNLFRQLSFFLHTKKRQRPKGGDPHTPTRTPPPNREQKKRERGREKSRGKNLRKWKKRAFVSFSFFWYGGKGSAD